MDIQITWAGFDDIDRGLGRYADAVEAALLEVGQMIAPMLEAYAKENAPWMDRTANARQTLQGTAVQVARMIVDVYLAHGMDYGIYLETRFAGRYAILWPTIQALLPQIERILRTRFS